MVTPAEIDRLLQSIFDPAANSAGFQKLKNRKYVRERSPHFRDVLQFRSFVSLDFVWGVSLNFVPHIAGRYTESVQWHRTKIGARADLSFGGNESTHIPKYRFQLENAEKAVGSLICVRDVGLQEALSFFDQIRTFRDLGGLFLDVATQPRSFRHYYQKSLAYCFYLAKSGDEIRARRFMSLWIQNSHFREETNEKILRLFERTCLAPVAPQ